MKRAELVGHPAHPGWIPVFPQVGESVGNESSAVIGPILLRKGTLQHCTVTLTHNVSVCLSDYCFIILKSKCVPDT